MLNVSYKNRIGYYTKTELWPDEPEQKYKNWICHANCLWADMFFYKAKEDFNRFGRKFKKGEKIAQLIAFWHNTKHLKAALKDGAYGAADDFHFFVEEMDAEIWPAVKILAQAGKKVTIETKKKK